jgi:hypothetical protein
MNHNDMDRYFWRTGQRWTGHNGPSGRPAKASSRRGFFLVAASFAMTLVMLFLLRHA